MKVNGTGQPPTPGVSGSETAAPVDKTGEAASKRDPAVTGKAFAEKLAGARPPEASGMHGVSQPPHAGAVAVKDVAAELQAGKITAHAAVDRIIERVVAKQVGADAPAAVRDQVRAALATALQDDPLLAAKLKQLEG